MSEKKSKEQNGIDTNGFLKGCTICNEGLANSMENSIKKHGVSEATAARLTAEAVNKRIGTDLFTADALRKRYRRQRGKMDGSENIKPMKPKPEPWKCKNGKQLHTNLNDLYKEMKKAAQLAQIDSKTAKKIYALSHEIQILVKPLINWEED